MNKIEKYRNYIKQIIRSHARHKPDYGEVEMQTIFDTEMTIIASSMSAGSNEKRQYGCLAHVDIKNEKIWVQYDGTEAGIANELVELGVPHSDIVLADLPISIRPYTDFAVE